MKNSIFLIYLLSSGMLLHAQLCDFPYPSEDLCSSAHLICNLDGYCSDNSRATRTDTPSSFCGEVENNNWIKFIPGTEEMEIEITVDNCRKERGLQIQVFSTLSCNKFISVVDCLDPVLTIDTLILKKLEIGKTYYLMTDGKAGDVCHYQYRVLKGQTLTPSYAGIKPFGGLCENSTLNLESTIINKQELNYFWTTSDGEIVSDPNKPTVDVSKPGHYQLKVLNMDGCGDSISVEVITIPSPDLKILQPDSINCVGDSIIEIEAICPLDVICLWTSKNGEFVSSHDKSMVKVSQPGLYSLLILDPKTGCINIDSVEVIVEKSTPFAIIEPVDDLVCINSGVFLDATGSSHGNDFLLEWFTVGGHFLNGIESLMPEINASGNYILNITNQTNGCISSDNVWVESRLLLWDVKISQPCFDDSTGTIDVYIKDDEESLYEYSFSGGAFSYINQVEKPILEDVKVSIRDIDGCVWDTIVQITPLLPVTVDFKNKGITVDLGEIILLNPEISCDSSIIQEIWWEPRLDCQDCTEQMIVPVQDEVYKMSIMDENGCIGIDSVSVRINKQRNIFIPNAFSPNFDGVNDIFYILGGAEIEEIKNVEIFDRWGGVVFRNQNFPPNKSSYGWDGIFQNKKLEEGVFSFVARVEYIDGEILDYKGSLVLLK